LKWYETKMIRQLRFAGKFKDTEKFEVAECYKQPNIVKLSWLIYFHLSNNSVDPETWSIVYITHKYEKGNNNHIHNCLDSNWICVINKCFCLVNNDKRNALYSIMVYYYNWISNILKK